MNYRYIASSLVLIGTINEGKNKITQSKHIFNVKIYYDRKNEMQKGRIYKKDDEELIQLRTTYI